MAKKKKPQGQQGITPASANVNNVMSSGKSLQTPGMNINTKPTKKKKLKAKKKMQPTTSSIQQLTPQSGHTPVFQSQVPTVTSTSGGAVSTDVNTQQQGMQAKPKKKKKPKPKKNMQPFGNNFQQQMQMLQSGLAPVFPFLVPYQYPSGTVTSTAGKTVSTDVNAPQQGMPKKKTKPKQKKKMQPSGNNFQQQMPQSGLTPVLQSPVPCQGLPATLTSRARKTVSTNVNTQQQGMQGKPKKKKNPKPKKKMQPSGNNIQQLIPQSGLTPVLQSPVPCQGPSATLTSTAGKTVSTKDTKQQGMQAKPKKKKNPKPKKKIQPSGNNIQQLMPQSARTPVVQSPVPSRDSSATVSSTSGKTASAAAQEEVIVVEKEVTVVDLTEEEAEGESVNGVIEADCTNATRLLAERPDILSDTTPNLWHKVTVIQALDYRIAALSAINRQILPLKLIPYFFRLENGCITFLVSNCSAALKKLFQRHLKVPYMLTEIELKVQLRAKKLNLSAILKKIISKRLNSEKKFLDLSNLTSIPEFQQMLYHPSETSHLHQQLLDTAQVMAPNLAVLSLAGNSLTTLSHFATVFADKTKWRSLKVLDVTDNKIATTAELAAFKSLPITELYLHKNPVCGKHKAAHTYISVIRVDFPRLRKLDGIYLEHLPGLPQWRPNYISCSTHGDSAELADQFIEHFFTLYDSEDRTWLWELYHEDAYFSLSSRYLPGQSTSSNARLSSYIADCRNLLHDRLKSKAALAHGAEKIITKLVNLPRTRHDPYSFTVDLLHHSSTSTILTVTGVFKENTSTDISPRHFMRTFVLVRLANDEYQIANDILYVTNATTTEAEAAFRYIKPHTNLKKTDPRRQEMRKMKRDDNSMIQKYSQLTNMTVGWSRKSLGDAGWNLKRALETFIAMYEAGSLPPGRFKK